ncbi:unnamed protein product [Leptidea sinapis]|uniref:DOCKER domain-containing protein n=1 Tax=Leptidea sinapis TaxID=189913 RepID=A0A5E4Q7J4_9NEOP|nr:unnamed protein product [Leptidea sinapis]
MISSSAEVDAPPGLRKLALELVPRRGAEAVDPEDISLVELYRVHVESAERAAAWRGTLRRAGGSGSINSGSLTNAIQTPTVQSHYLMCSMRDFGHTAGGDEAELLLWLHDARRAQPLSERFRVRIARDGFSNYIDRLHANSTLFAVQLQEGLWVPECCRISEAVASGATVTAKRGFPDVIMPGDVRNDLYLTLERAEFERGGKSTAKNVLATVTVHDGSGQAINNERKLFGFAFARLMEPSGATLRDGAHELYVYKCDDSSKLTSGSYLSLPSCATDVVRTPPSNGLVASFPRSTKENCTISTLLCSTKLTQNEKVQETLLRVLRLGDGLSCEELIKFLRDVLDALFALFSTEDGNSLLDEPRFQHFRPVLDVYIEEHFSAALVYKGLLSSVQHCAEWAAGAEGQEPIRKCLRSLGAVFRLAVRSRCLFARATGGQYEDSFRRDVRAALHALKALAQHPHREHLAPAQVALMTSWASVASEVSSALGAAEAARVSAAMLDAFAAGVPAPLARARLAAAHQILKGPLGQDAVLTTACHHLRVHLARRDELPQCADMIGELVTLLWRKDAPDSPLGDDQLDPDVDVLCLNTLDVLVETGSMVAGLLGVMELLKGAHYQRLWSHLAPHPHDRKPLKDFLMRAFLVFRHLIEQDVFPGDWMVLRVQSCKVLLSALQDLAKPLLERFLGDEPPQFDSQLIGAAVGALLEITLVGELRRAALGALVALMAAERAATGSARRTEAALVDKLDSLVADNKADDHYRRLFDTNFYKNEIDRKEMYLRYVYKLHDLHISSDNFVEAGCTLLCWEKGLPLLRELATLYEMKLCDYPRLAECLRTHATFLDSVMKELRPEPEYFRVGFYGKGCPPFVRICNVKPVARLESCPSNAPEQVKRFYSFNDVNTFLSDRPLHKPPIDKDNEFKSLWIERTTLVTENILPGILRWSEVVTRSVEEITPVEFACETMESTERELRNLISQYTADPSRNINPFSMRLQGTIDANVQTFGGAVHTDEAEPGTWTSEGKATPLPPVPALDKRSHSIQQGDGYYEDGHLYNKPIYSLEDSIDNSNSIMSSSLPLDSRESEDTCMVKSAPPLPLRPKSGDPRSPTRPVNLELVESMRYEEIISMMSEPLRVDEGETPPPIPPKGLGHLSSFDSGHHENGESHC